MEIHDIFGIKPIGETAQQVTQVAIDGAKSFLEAVCKPGLEEMGIMIKDNVRIWRLNNIIRMLDKAKGRMCFDGQDLNLCANARVGLSIMECCSEVDDEGLQELWAGLFVSSCTSDGRDDSNMIFVDLLRRMSSVEARIVDYACQHCEKKLYPNQLIMADEFVVSYSQLIQISKIDDRYRLDSELDHMRSIELLMVGGLFGTGFSALDDTLDADITPSALALNLYYKTHSSGMSPIEFWGDGLVHVPADTGNLSSE